MLEILKCVHIQIQLQKFIYFSYSNPDVAVLPGATMLDATKVDLDCLNMDTCIGFEAIRIHKYAISKKHQYGDMFDYF